MGGVKQRQRGSSHVFSSLIARFLFMSVFIYFLLGNSLVRGLGLKFCA